MSDASTVAHANLPTMNFATKSLYTMGLVTLLLYTHCTSHPCHESNDYRVVPDRESALVILIFIAHSRIYQWQCTGVTRPTLHWILELLACFFGGIIPDEEMKRRSIRGSYSFKTFLRYDNKYFRDF